MRVLYYALGGGQGHAVRGLATLARLRRRERQARVLLAAPSRFTAWAREQRVPLLSPPDDCRGRETLAEWARRTVETFAPDILLVDVFARGVLGELGEAGLGADGSPACWLVCRRIRPDYYLEPGVRGFVEGRYRGILWCEPPPPALDVLRVRQQLVSPVLIRRPGNCLGRERARRALGVKPESRLLLALGSGDRQHQGDLLRLLDAICTRLRAHAGCNIHLLFLSTLLKREDLPGASTDARVEQRFPAMRYLRAADLVVAAGGYHAFHEIRQLVLPAVFVPQKRKYDDQFWRVRNAPRAREPAELEAAVAGSLLGSGQPRPSTDRTAKREVVSVADQLLDIVLQA
jgi:hypothetical protein